MYLFLTKEKEVSTDTVSVEHRVAKCTLVIDLEQAQRGKKIIKFNSLKMKSPENLEV